MIQTVLKIDGMVCGMCEAHINDAIRYAFPVKRVTSSHVKGQTVILTENEIDSNQLKSVLAQAGYTVLSAEQMPYEKKRLFGR